MDIAVIGGGIQGICTALEFARRGARVDLLESRPALMQGASRENEGKIHLGFVYANDSSLATARLMSLGAARFAPLVARWLERSTATMAVSRPFTYVVHRDSLLNADELAARYEAISSGVRQTMSLPGADYFGLRNVERIRRLSQRETERQFDAAHVQAAFESAEIAVDPDAIADLLVERVRSDPRIRVRTATRVVAACRVPAGVRLTIHSEERSAERFDHVINCAWCGRLTIDATMGITPEHAWSFRRRDFLRVPSSHLAQDVPSVTIVLGGYGDVVRYAGGDVQLSWYPVCCRGIELGLAPAPEMQLPATQAAFLRENIVQELAKIVPALRERSPEAMKHAQLRNGVVFALGATDIDDRRSQLHQRYQVGPRSFGRYHTVDTGKYTVAPLFAQQLADSILSMEKAA